jgi:hypothetical protein
MRAASACRRSAHFAPRVRHLVEPVVLSSPSISPSRGEFRCSICTSVFLGCRLRRIPRLKCACSVTRSPGSVRSPCQCHTPCVKKTTEPLGISIRTPLSLFSPGRGGHRSLWLPGTSQVGPDSTRQSSSAHTAHTGEREFRIGLRHVRVVGVHRDHARPGPFRMQLNDAITAPGPSDASTSVIIGDSG